MAEKKSLPPRRPTVSPPKNPVIRERKAPPVRRNTMDVDMSWLEEIPREPESPPARRPSKRPSAPPKEPKKAMPPGLRGAGARHNTLEVRAEWLEQEEPKKRQSERPRVSSRPPAKRSIPPEASDKPKAKPPPLPVTPGKRIHPPPLPREEADDPPKRPSRRPSK